MRRLITAAIIVALFFPAWAEETGAFYTYYRVQATDTLAEIAFRHNVTRRDLVEMNPSLGGTEVEPGDLIFVPNQAYRPADATTAYKWEKLKARPVYAKPAPPLPLEERLLAAGFREPEISQPEPEDGLEALPRLALDSPSSDEWGALASFGVEGKEVSLQSPKKNLMVLPDKKVVSLSPKRQLLASRRGRQIYALLKTARSLMGIPYVWGGESPTGADCSGYVQLVFGRHGVRLPRTADIQFEVGKKVPAGGERPGDLVFFETYAPGASHVGIYAGRRYFIHASSGAKQVTIGSLEDPYFKARYLGARRHL